MKKLIVIFMVLLSLVVTTACTRSSSWEENQDNQSRPSTNTTNQSSISDNTTSELFTEINRNKISPDTSESSTPKKWNRLIITVNSKEFYATLYENPAAENFADNLPIAIKMSDLNDNEKFCYLPFNLPTIPQDFAQIKSGDIMLYGNNCLVMFYKSFSSEYSYTPLGKIENPQTIENELGKGDVDISIKLA